MFLALLVVVGVEEGIVVLSVELLENVVTFVSFDLAMLAMSMVLVLLFSCVIFPLMIKNIPNNVVTPDMICFVNGNVLVEKKYSDHIQ